MLRFGIIDPPLIVSPLFAATFSSTALFFFLFLSPFVSKTDDLS